MLWKVLDPHSRKAWQSEAECQLIKFAFTGRDGTKITSYADFRVHLVRHDGGMACSKAIASRRIAIRQPWRYRQWMEARIPFVPVTPAGPAAVAADVSQPAWGSADRDAGGWGSGESWISGGAWRTEAVWGSGSGSWDSNKPWTSPRIPKSKGKRKRQRQRKAAQRALLAVQMEEGWRQAQAEWERAMDSNPTPSCC
ncbi:hypothetical protein MSAN_01977600 [Mycena sanguinolenta]|uniref:Uncharacterized protein n=1 Tax=Mycena sanguinolenta TaxID=230812 RepID=A0A8H7CPJ1_9AGAR|nr:hypothetical protein MSAN_01977600 [Mycena sanguinolenta]